MGSGCGSVGRAVAADTRYPHQEWGDHLMKVFTNIEWP